MSLRISVVSLIFFLEDLSIDVSGVLKSPTIIVFPSISPFMSGCSYIRGICIDDCNILFFFFFFFWSFVLFRARVLSELQQLAYARDTARWGPSLILQDTPQLTATPDLQPTEQGQGLNPQPHGS